MDFLNNFNLGDINTILTGGVGTVSFFAVFAYLVWKWVTSGEFFGLLGS